MTPRLAPALLVFGIAVSLAACGGDSGSTATTSATVATTVAPTTTVAASTTSSSTSSTSTTSTVAPVVGLELSSTGLGDALFGAGVDGVLAYVESILGEPTSDTGWVDPVVTGSACMGNEVRLVTWHDLSLFFSDESLEATGFRHFASFTYGPAAGAELVPNGLRTVLADGVSAGVAVGDSVRALLEAHPGTLLAPEDEMSGPSFFIEEGLTGFLTGVGANDRITSFVGGFGCGE